MNEQEKELQEQALKEAQGQEIERRFTYHKPREGQPEKYQAIRDAAKGMAHLFNEFCPPSRELALAHTNLEQVVMWANAAIARGHIPPARVKQEPIEPGQDGVHWPPGAGEKPGADGPLSPESMASGVPVEPPGAPEPAEPVESGASPEDGQQGEGAEPVDGPGPGD